MCLSLFSQCLISLQSLQSLKKYGNNQNVNFILNQLAKLKKKLSKLIQVNKSTQILKLEYETLMNKFSLASASSLCLLCNQLQNAK